MDPINRKWKFGNDNTEYDYPKDAIKQNCPYIPNNCPSNTSCTSITKNDDNLEVNCKGYEMSKIGYIQGTNKFYWIDDMNITPNEYNSVEEAISARCKQLSEVNCPENTSCVSTEYKNNNIWKVKCNNKENELKRQSNGTWVYVNSDNTNATNKTYNSSEEAIKEYCINIPSCPADFNSSCLSIERINDYQLQIDCKSADKSSLFYDQGKWNWTNETVKYNNVIDAINARCKPLPEVRCPESSSCVSILNESKYTWKIKCKFGGEKLLQFSPVDSKWTIDGSSVKYDNPTDAIRQVCPFISTDCPSNTSCISVTKLSDASANIKCNGYIDKTLTMYEDKWNWVSSEDITKYNTIQDAIKARCQIIPEVKCPDNTSCLNITQINNNTWNLKCQNKENDLTRYENGKWGLNRNENDQTTWNTYNSSSDAIKTYCPLIPSSCPTTVPNSCFSVTKNTETSVGVKCKGYEPNLLNLNIDKWRWYNMTKDELDQNKKILYDTINDAIISTCKPLPEVKCPENTSCLNVTEPIDDNIWKVKCQDKENNLIRNSYGTWNWDIKDGTNQTIDTYNSSDDAIKEYCKIAPSPKPVDCVLSSEWNKCSIDFQRNKKVLETEKYGGRCENPIDTSNYCLNYSVCSLLANKFMRNNQDKFLNNSSNLELWYNFKCNNYEQTPTNYLDQTREQVNEDKVKEKLMTLNDQYSKRALELLNLPQYIDSYCYFPGNITDENYDCSISATHIKDCNKLFDRQTTDLEDYNKTLKCLYNNPNIDKYNEAKQYFEQKGYIFPPYPTVDCKNEALKCSEPVEYLKGCKPYLPSNKQTTNTQDLDYVKTCGIKGLTPDEQYKQAQNYFLNLIPSLTLPDKPTIDCTNIDNKCSYPTEYFRVCKEYNNETTTNEQDLEYVKTCKLFNKTSEIEYTKAQTYFNNKGLSLPSVDIDCNYSYNSAICDKPSSYLTNCKVPKNINTSNEDDLKQVQSCGIENKISNEEYTKAQTYFNNKGLSLPNIPSINCTDPDNSLCSDPKTFLNVCKPYLERKASNLLKTDQEYLNQIINCVKEILSEDKYNEIKPYFQQRNITVPEYSSIFKCTTSSNDEKCSKLSSYLNYCTLNKTSLASDVQFSENCGINQKTSDQEYKNAQQFFTSKGYTLSDKPPDGVYCGNITSENECSNMYNYLNYCDGKNLTDQQKVDKINQCIITNEISKQEYDKVKQYSDLKNITIKDYLGFRCDNRTNICKKPVEFLKNCKDVIPSYSTKSDSEDANDVKNCASDGNISSEEYLKAQTYFSDKGITLPNIINEIMNCDNNDTKCTNPYNYLTVCKDYRVNKGIDPPTTDDEDYQTIYKCGLLGKTTDTAYRKAQTYFDKLIPPKVLPNPSLICPTSSCTQIQQIPDKYEWNVNCNNNFSGKLSLNPNMTWSWDTAVKGDPTSFINYESAISYKCPGDREIYQCPYNSSCMDLSVSKINDKEYVYMKYKNKYSENLLELNLDNAQLEKTTDNKWKWYDNRFNSNLYDTYQDAISQTFPYVDNANTVCQNNSNCKEVSYNSPYKINIKCSTDNDNSSVIKLDKTYKVSEPITDIGKQTYYNLSNNNNDFNTLNDTIDTYCKLQNTNNLNNIQINVQIQNLSNSIENIKTKINTYVNSYNNTQSTLDAYYNKESSYYSLITDNLENNYKNLPSILSVDDITNNYVNISDNISKLITLLTSIYPSVTNDIDSIKNQLSDVYKSQYISSYQKDQIFSMMNELDNYKRIIYNNVTNLKNSVENKYTSCKNIEMLLRNKYSVLPYPDNDIVMSYYRVISNIRIQYRGYVIKLRSI